MTVLLPCVQQAFDVSIAVVSAKIAGHYGLPGHACLDMVIFCHVLGSCTYQHHVTEWYRHHNHNDSVDPQAK